MYAGSDGEADIRRDGGSLMLKCVVIPTSPIFRGFPPDTALALKFMAEWSNLHVPDVLPLGEFADFVGFLDAIGAFNDDGLKATNIRSIW